VSAPENEQHSEVKMAQVRDRYRLRDTLFGASIGLAGGLLQGYALGRSLILSAAAGGLYGMIFGLFFAERGTSPGAGLLWGLSTALVDWCIVPVVTLLFGSGKYSAGTSIEIARSRFPLLVSNLLCLGTPIGLSFGILARRNRTAPQTHWARAITSGGLAGIGGGLIFGHWMHSGGFYPLNGGLADVMSHATNVLVQFAIALLIGVTFGILFQHDVRGYGSCMGWGLGYALLSWFAGPLTLFPLASQTALNWSVDAASDLFGNFIGYILYGLILGVLYATIDRVWLRLFVQSDPLRREPNGLGFRLLLSLQWGALSGLVGGVISSPLMLEAGVLTHVVGIDTHLSTLSGLFVHLLVSSLIGMSFGLLFRGESSSLAMSGAWGWVFGLIWWYAGPLTLLPLVLTGEIDWRIGAATTLLPSLFGHLMYGAFTGFSFYAIEQRYLRRHVLSARVAANEVLRLRPLGTPASALWFLSIFLGIAVPILLG
jgi:hypothetical protein